MPDKRLRFFLVGAAMACAALCAPRATAQQQRFFTIGTGAVSGVYYGVGDAVCQLIHKERVRHGLRCSVEATPAAVHNLKALRKNDLRVVLAQADTEYAAYHGLADFTAAGPDRELRVIASLHLELMTVVVRRGSGITAFGDLRGKRVSIGSGHSGTRYSVEKLLLALDMQKNDFASISDLKADEHRDALCKGRIDAFVFTVGHPSRNIGEAAAACAISFLPLAGDRITTLIRANNYYTAIAIPGGIYPGNPTAVETFGARAVLLTTASAGENLIYEITRAIFDNLAEFKAKHPALADLEAARMSAGGAAAPLHPGARRYYREKGLLP